MSRPARRLVVALALASTLGVSGMLALPAAASAAPAAVAEVPDVIAPEDGAFVDPASVVLEWTAVESPGGYEVTWANAAGGDAGVAATTATSATIQVDGGTFVWQVRALPDGEWSAPASFHADLELPTLAAPEQPAAAPATAPGGFGAIPGSVWIVGALGFSAVFLAAVVIQSRAQRERDA